ncbi:MAG: lipoprotein signal peptidase [Rubrivivax sp.]|nr:lipoprotein signal peptidase [Rubrivivax sp.]MBK7262876.1 lipoprotein signal peptidase [Rubrivivax sp.]MBK8528776.1 lipoprotein signal peptidase [Rubrivivax sp.]
MARSPARGGNAPSLALWLALAAIVILADQVTKTLILGAFQYGDTQPVTSFFNIVRAHNSGAAFSFLAGASGWQRWFFAGLGLVASIFIVWMMRSHPTQRLFCFAVSMIMGGALGNVIDRLLHGYVVDFLQFRFGFLSPLFQGGYFPAFNLADSAITLGAICLILDEILRVRRAG